MNAGVTFYAAKPQLEAWLAAASAGSSAIYATGPSLDQGHEVVQLVKDWRETGEVTCVQRRVDGRLRYEVQRVRREVSEGGPARRLRITTDLEETPEGKLLLQLSRLANMGLPCPTNAELADQTGLRDAEAARYRFNNLVKAGHILVVTTGERRVVTILQTGKRTVDLSDGPVAARAGAR